MNFNLPRKLLNIYLSLLLPLSFILSFNSDTILFLDSKETFFLISLVFLFIVIPYLLINKFKVFPLDLFSFLYVIISCIIYLIFEDRLLGKLLLLTIILIFFLSLLLSNFLSNYKSINISHIIFIFLICCHLISLYNFYIFNKKKIDLSENKSTNSSKNIDIFEVNNIELDINEKTVFFYVVMDGFPSIERLNAIGFSTSELINELNENDFYIIKETYADYVRTEKSISSTLNLGKIKDNNTMSKKDYYYHIQNSRFINFFKDAGAEIVWFPNTLYISSCPKSFPVTCVRDKSNLKILENEITIEYLKYFLINDYYTRNFIWKLLGSFNYFKNDLNLNIDLITDYIKKNEIQKPHLFYAHILSPHPPYRLNSSCQIQDDNNLNNDQLFLQQVECNIKQIKKFLKIIKDKIPNSYIFLHSDHGTPLYSEKEQEPKNFVSISKNLLCEDKANLDHNSNIEIFKKILSCVNKN
jgi:hypothetical protein